MKKIKVLHLTSTPKGLGGAEKLLIDMADKYDRSRFEVSYCNLFSEDPANSLFEAALQKKGVVVHSISGKRLFDIPSVVFGLRKLIVQEGFDILHTHLLHATIIGAAVASTIHRLKVVVTKHYTQDLISDRKILFFLTGSLLDRPIGSLLYRALSARR